VAEPGTAEAAPNRHALAADGRTSPVPERVETGEPEEGVDTTRVMQLTFLTTLAVGVPLVVALSVLVTLPTWEARAEFAVRVGALIWLVTGLGFYVRERRRDDPPESP